MVRRSDITVHLARTRPQWSANESPINPATAFKQAVCWSGRGARGGHCILKPSPRKLQRHCRLGSIHIEVACDYDRTFRVVASRVGQDFPQL